MYEGKQGHNVVERTGNIIVYYADPTIDLDSQDSGDEE